MKFGDIGRDLDIEDKSPDWPENLTIEEVEKEMSWRKEVLPQLVGQLYPRIVLDQLEKLEDRLKDLKLYE